MSLPDEWTRYREDGSEIADGPRYKLCGNGLVVNCAEWLAQRTRRVLLARKEAAA
jgi:site-specific DNA-cytosine methylase